MLSQTYKNCKILFVDDASGLNNQQIKFIKNKLEGHFAVFNDKRKYSLFNAYHLINKFADKNEAVIFNLDGDDWLINNKVLEYIAEVYSKTKCLLTYGECLIWDGKRLSRESRHVKEFTNVPYPKKIIKENLYRKYPFLPLHPRTWKVWLFKKIKKIDFLRLDESWLQFAEDQAMFYPMLEMANGRYSPINKPLYIYNTASENSDTKKNLTALLKDELFIRRKKIYAKLINTF